MPLLNRKFTLPIPVFELCGVQMCGIGDFDRLRACAPGAQRYSNAFRFTNSTDRGNVQCANCGLHSGGVTKGTKNLEGR